MIGFLVKRGPISLLAGDFASEDSRLEQFDNPPCVNSSRSAKASKDESHGVAKSNTNQQVLMETAQSDADSQSTASDVDPQIMAWKDESQGVAESSANQQVLMETGSDADSQSMASEGMIFGPAMSEPMNMARRNRVDLAKCKPREIQSATNLDQRSVSRKHLEEVLFYQSGGAFRLWKVVAQRRVDHGHVGAKFDISITQKDRVSIVVVVSSPHDDVSCLWRQFQRIDDKDKELVVIEAHGHTPNVILEAYAKVDKRFVHFAMRVDPPPSSAFGKAAGTILASGEYVVRMTLHDIHAADTLKSKLPQRCVREALLLAM